MSEDAPSRRFGLAAITAMVTLSAGAMAWESRRERADPPAAPAAPAGFRDDAWFLPDDELLGFVEIPAGAFAMGSDPAVDGMAYANERWSARRRQGRVTLPAFYIARFETTAAQYAAYARDAGIERTEREAPGRGDLPAAGISWTEALAYARWLDRRLREDAAAPAAVRDFLAAGARVRLPSEAEWEKAARGGDGRIFPWGNRPRTDRANFGADGPAPVGGFACPECAHGLADMAGNVWEMTLSPLRDYPFSPDPDRADPAGEPLYVMRGGGWADGPGDARAAVRGAVDPGARHPAIGFRVVVALP